MANYGGQFINDKKTYQIDGTNMGICLLAKQTISLKGGSIPTQGGQTGYIGKPAKQMATGTFLVCVNSPTWCKVLGMNSLISARSNYYLFQSIFNSPNGGNTPGGTATCYEFGTYESAPKPSGSYGMQIFNESGKVVYDSRLPPLRVYKSIVQENTEVTVALPNDGRTYAFSVTGGMNGNIAWAGEGWQVFGRINGRNVEVKYLIDSLFSGSSGSDIMAYMTLFLLIVDVTDL